MPSDSKSFTISLNNPDSIPAAKLIIGRLPFLVCAPFFHSTLAGAPGIDFRDGVPSFLNDELQAGRIDAAPSSSFEYGLHYRDYVLIPGVSTSSRMEMKSVLFLSQAPWETLSGKQVGLSPDSATSNALFRILCSERYHVRPELLSGTAGAKPGEMSHGNPAVLPLGSRGAPPVGQVFIGDKALGEALSGRWAHKYDLADEWARWQGLPFSFGLWIVRRDAVRGKGDLVRRFHSILMESLAAFRAQPEQALQAWTRVYPSPLPHDLMLRFYETADYNFTAEHAESLRRFYALACSAGLLPEQPVLDYAEI